MFWILQVCCLLYFADMIQSEPSTFKALMIAMVAYLFIPNLYYKLLVASEKRYEQ
jgi:hypothetical protein